MKRGIKYILILLGLILLMLLWFLISNLDFAEGVQNDIRRYDSIMKTKPDTMKYFYPKIGK